MIDDDKAAGGLNWLWRLIKGWLPQTLGAAATGASIVWASYGSTVWTEGIWALWVTIGLLIAALVAQLVIQRPTYMELARLHREAEDESQEKAHALGQVMQALLRRVAEYCETDQNTDRVSLYYFHDDGFVMLARYSRHPKYALPGRRVYPVGQGAIGDAWDKGSVAMKLPSTTLRWVQKLTGHHGYSEEEAKNLTMQCESIAGLRIEVDFRSVGVLVFESTNPGRVSQDTLDRASKSMVLGALGEMVSAAGTLTPRGAELVAGKAAPRPSKVPPWKATKQAA